LRPRIRAARLRSNEAASPQEGVAYRALDDPIANRTNGKSFAGDPESIENIYNSISAEQ
jgi:hypothetical protein